MRHGKKFNHLSRKSAHRKAMLANMACSLIEYKRIKTTLAKAKALRVYVEPLITKSKDDTTHSRRTVFSYLKQKEAITELFGDVAVKVNNRAGGYTRILKLSNRLGDNAKMAFIELVDYNEDYISNKPKRKKARRAKKRTGETGSSNSLPLSSSACAPLSSAPAHLPAQGRVGHDMHDNCKHPPLLLKSRGRYLWHVPSVAILPALLATTACLYILVDLLQLAHLSSRMCVSEHVVPLCKLFKT